jgi:hypothetical protein
MAGAGYRTFASGEVLTANNVQTYLMDQAVQVYAGTAARASAVPSPSTGMVAYSTATGLQVFNGSAWTSVGGATYGAATGGASTASATISGVNYTILTFTATGTLTVSTAGLFDVLMFSGGAAGGGSGTSASNIGSGGGAGGRYVLLTGLYLDANQTITIGAGGSGASGRVHGAVGAVTTLGSLITTLRAGGGESLGSTPVYNPVPSGGACGIGAGAITGLIDTTFGGYSGGAGSGSNGAGGGGGATAVGANGVSNTGGAGGAGYDVSSFTGAVSALYKGAGGGGGGSTAGGAGGSSVGGAGGTAAGSAAAANTASGGGGSCETASAAGGSGGSGIVYVRFKV